MQWYAPPAQPPSLQSGALLLALGKGVGGRRPSQEQQGATCPQLKSSQQSSRGDRRLQQLATGASFAVAPSRRWDGGNNPEQTDFVSVRNLVRACPASLKRFVLTTSAGVERSGQFPFSILNLFGEERGWAQGAR